MFYADLHIHSKYSRATSRDLDLEHLALAAARKGVQVLGTGDFTHPAWRAELREKLEPAEPGLFRLRPDLGRRLDAQVPGASGIRFMLQVELSTIYKKENRVRKVHHLVYVPDWDSAERLCAALGRIGNLAADGRPILGLDSRDLLELVLSSGAGAYLVPAHIWTPWFSVFGAQSGFDSLQEAYGELSAHIFALETGLSSNPPMNWRCSMLDGYRLVSNSDAHSPGKIGREACRFNTELDYFAIRSALETGQGYEGTIEFFPEEGKYHLDGHRACGVRLEPEATRALEGRCPVCGRPLTIGVLHRVEELADRTEPTPPPGAAGFESLVPLEEVLAEVLQSRPSSSIVQAHYEQLVRRLGPELLILQALPLEEVRRHAPPLLEEALRRMRAGEVLCEPGFDGQYGRIRLFRPEELQSSLFAPGSVISRPTPPPRTPPAELSSSSAAQKAPLPEQNGPDPEQERALLDPAPAVLVEAGPGTGKTHLLVHRIARAINEEGLEPASCVAITFTRRAAEELRLRLSRHVPAGASVLATTFHGLALRMLNHYADRIGLPLPIRVATERERLEALAEVLGMDLSRIRNPQAIAERNANQVRSRLREKGLLDVEELIPLATELLESDAEVRHQVQSAYRFVAVDEYQDLDATQYRFLRALVGPQTRLFAIGDPDQAIYGFRGGDVRFFVRFRSDFPGASILALERNYRSTRQIVDCALQVVAPTSLRPGRRLIAIRGSGPPVRICAFPTERDEAAWIAREIERRIGGMRLESLSGEEATEPMRFGDFAVLYRTEAQAEAIEEALSRAGIPYEKRSHRAVIEHPALQSLLEPLRQAGERLWEALEALLQAERAHPRPERLLWLERLQQLARAHEADPAGFWNALAMSTQADFWDARADRVWLLTLHAAKGLEFPVVFLSGCEAGLLPLELSEGRERCDEAEERRLFFVGLTRARDQVLISYAESRLRYERRLPTGPSPFLYDLPRAHLQWDRAPVQARASGRQLELF